MSENATGTDNQQERFLMQLSPSYIVALVDGEGYFSIYANRRKQKTWILNEVKFTFGIKLKAEDGFVVLNQIEKFFDCGSVYYRKDTRKNFSDCYEYQVKSHRDIFGKIIPFFQENPLQFPTKKRTFKQFCEIAQMIQAREHLQNGGIEKIKKLAMALH